MSRSIFFSLCLVVLNLNAQNSKNYLVDNFILSDLSGKEYDLDRLISEGKHVILNFGAAWSPSSWNYETSNTLNFVDQYYQRLGNQNVVVLFIESDLKTDISCIKGNKSCSSSSMGDWTSLVKYPIIDLNSSELLKALNIDKYPTIIGIKPDRSITDFGQADMYKYTVWISGQTKDVASIGSLNHFEVPNKLRRNTKKLQLVTSIKKTSVEIKKGYFVELLTSLTKISRISFE